ncbi:methyltransferase domain-containing protein [Streptomyces sp. NRRL F-4489]|uniref:methyltransferase domain-containing protein n=1 Tax=Streptomyces sp. NRRL F-4489 TaxID=1609095 RepID=UPI000AEC36B8|nr:methyltransferase domain-containing protein [Streptomyces sp. NRRL F-4489]
MTHPLQGHTALVQLLDERGLLSPAWRAVWERTPREPYLPDRVWRQDTDRCRPVTEPTERASLVYADEPVVIQVDDGAEDGPGVATSSNSQPSMVARMLHLLDVRDGQQVLEIGTATGYVAALLSARIGDQHVTSVEIDPSLSARAEANLAAAGYRPRLVIADGETGWPSGAPYHRILATCALRHIPPALIKQLHPGGVLVAPRIGDIWCGSLVRLVAAGDGTASGRFAGPATYMPMRSHRAPNAAAPDTSRPRSRRTTVPPRAMLTPGFALYASARLPGVTLIEGRHDASLRVWVSDGEGSGAIADADATVTAFGDRDLWEELETAWREWSGDLQRPAAEHFGLTASANIDGNGNGNGNGNGDGNGEYVWLHDPRRPVRPLAPDED